MKNIVNRDITIQKGLKEMPPKVGTRFVEDENHHRTGWLLEKEITDKMLECVRTARLSISKDKVASKEPLTHQLMMDQIDILRGVMMMVRILCF